jgi:hypothetical protein
VAYEHPYVEDVVVKGQKVKAVHHNRQEAQLAAITARLGAGNDPLPLISTAQWEMAFARRVPAGTGVDSGPVNAVPYDRNFEWLAFMIFNQSPFPVISVPLVKAMTTDGIFSQTGDPALVDFSPDNGVTFFAIGSGQTASRVNPFGGNPSGELTLTGVNPGSTNISLRLLGSTGMFRTQVSGSGTTSVPIYLCLARRRVAGSGASPAVVIQNS